MTDNSAVKDITNQENESVANPALSQEHDTAKPRARSSSDPFSDWEAYRNSKIEIKVSKPIVKEELFARYLVYKIQGSDLKGYFEVTRRYSDFEKIRHLLVIKWPGCFVPSLPPKKLNNMERSVVEDRNDHLNKFCREIAEIPHLHYSDVFQIFLRSKMIDLDPLLQIHQKVKYEDIMFRYSAVFSHLSGKEINRETMFTIINFGAFLQRVKGMFEKFTKISKNFVTTRKNFSHQLLAMHNMMSGGYENHVFAEYHGRQEDRNIFNNTSNSKSMESMNKIKESQKQDTVETFHRWIKAEGRDIQAFCEAFAQREKYEALKSKAELKQKSETKDWQNLATGKKTFKTIFSKDTNKEEKIHNLEDKLANRGKEVDDLSRIQDMITMVLVYEEIEKFKAKKLERYYTTLKETSNAEIKSLSAIFDYWGGLVDHMEAKVVDS